MNYERMDSLIFISIHEETCVYDILLSIFNITQKLITYEDLDMGLNRLITNKLIRKEKKLYSKTNKGHSIVGIYNDRFEKDKTQELYQDFFKDIEMEKMPNLLRCFLPYSDYMSSLKKLASELGEDKLNIILQKPIEKRLKGENPSKSKDMIIKMLSDANITVDNLNLKDLCHVLREFMNKEYNAVDDDILFQTGVFFNKEIFTLNFTRQFSFNNRYGNYSHLTQLSITLEYENNQEFEGLSTVIWSTGYKSLDDFFDSVKLDESYLKIENIGKLKNIEINYERV